MRKKIVLNIINGISCIAIAAAVFVLLIVVMTKSGDVPNVMGYSAFRVLTGSMEPTIRTDSFILVKRVDASEIKAGDIISYFSKDPAYEGMVNTHRVVSIETDGNKWNFVTKGDANQVQDTYPTAFDDLIGKVVFTSYRLGVAIRLLANPLIFVPLILIPLFGILVYNLIKAIQTTRKIVKEEEEEAIKEALELLKKK
ncbi:MAG: signal peptidase I [Blautia sp.]